MPRGLLLHHRKAIGIACGTREYPPLRRIKEELSLLGLETNIKKYLNGDAHSEGRKPDARYASFDYCFNYFQSFRNNGNTATLAKPANIQRSCLNLGFYLASWGMLRGSSNLLQKSARYLSPIIRVIAEADAALWKIDAHCYTDENIELLFDAVSKFRQTQSDMSDILTTKIMLGVFGNVPAFDSQFKKGFRGTFCRKTLRRIGECYEANRRIIERYRIHTLDFATGKPTRHKYTRAKVIDMAFFIKGR